MKKHYFLTLLFTLCLSAISFGQVIFSEAFDYADGNLVPNGGWANFSGSESFIQVASGRAVVTHGGGSREDAERSFTQVAGDVYYAFDFIVDDLGSPISSSDEEYFAIFNESGSFNFRARLDIVAPSGGGDFSVGIASSGGSADIKWATDLTYGQSYRVVVKFDQVTGTAQLWVDATASTDTSITGADTGAQTVDVFALRQSNSADDETIRIDNLVVGQTFDDVKEFPSAGSDPSVSFNSPSNNQVFPSGTDNVNIILSIDNFTLSGDDGMGESDGTGDGYIKGTSTKNGQPDGDPQKIFDVNAGTFDLEDGSSYTLTAELVNNDGSSLSPKVEVTVAFSVELPCDIDLGTITEVCDAVTPNLDTYTATIPFTGGNTTTYTITAKDDQDNDVGTIGGDSPDSNATGNIIISNVPEGTNFTLKVVGGAGSSCDLTRNISSPTCVSLPIYEPFDYTANMNLISNLLWQDANTATTPNDIQVVANDDGMGNPVLGSYYGPSDLPAFTGNMVSLEGAGSDPYIGFSEVTSGTVYASFTFHVTDMSNAADPDGGYFAVFTEDGSFRGRIWIVDTNPGEGLTYNLGLSTTSGSSSTIHNGFTANIAEPVFVVIGYDVDNDEAKLWVVPDATSFGTNTPPAADVTLATSSTSKINRFLLRQDSTNETPAIDVDELRIGTSWADVTSDATASVGNNPIEGFTAFPNPVINKRLTITSQSSDNKQIILYNILGKKVFTQNFSGTRETIELNSVQSGLYIMKVIEGSKVSTSKLVVE